MNGLLKAGRPTGRTQEHIKDTMDAMSDKTRINLMMDKADVKRLKQYCLDNDVTLSEVIRLAVDKYISK